MPLNTINLTRKELYEEIWKISVAGVARKYGIPYGKCLAKIKEAHIPVPPAGYWTKVSCGKPVVQTPLSGDADTIVILEKEPMTCRTPKVEKEKQNISPKKGVIQESCETFVPEQQSIQKPEQEELNMVLEEEERQIVLNVAAQILLPPENTRMLPEIVAHRKRIEEWNKGKQQQKRVTGGDNRTRKVPPPFAEGISEEQRPRVFRIIDALAKAMIPLGWNLTSDLQFKMNQDSVTITFSESTDQIPHIPTKEENLSILKYEEERKKYPWASKPQIRKYDAVYTGRLSMSINGAKKFRDCRSYVLEDRLGDIMVSIYDEAERKKEERLAREEAERQRKEREQKREEQRLRYNTEVDRTIALINCATDYEIACRIRNYVSAMKKTHPDQDLSEWVSWAEAKADWFDPTIAKEDELLGKREHEKSQENKGPRHKGFWW